MSWRTMGNLALLILCLGGSAVAATPSPVADAAERRDPAAVRALLGGATLGNATGVNVPQPDGTTALHWAAYHDDADIAVVLLKAGANVNAVNRLSLIHISEPTRLLSISYAVFCL